MKLCNLRYKKRVATVLQGLTRLILVFVLSIACAKAQDTSLNALSQLNFTDYERLALDSDPVVKQHRNRANALRNRAVAAARAPDPNLRLGVVNVPIESFDFEQEAMTQKMIGLRQKFPAFGSLSSKQKELESLAKAEDMLAKERELQVLNGVRISWLELYYQFQAQDVITQSQQGIDELVEISQYRYRVGLGAQHDVLRAQLESSLLKDRIVKIEIDKDVVFAELGKWIGITQTQWRDPVQFPSLPQFPSLDQLRRGLRTHPMLTAVKLKVEAGQAGVESARAQYRPITTVDVSYGQRDAGRADFVSGVVSFSLPFFTSKKQDKYMRASRDDVEAAKDSVIDRHRMLQELLERNFHTWTRLDQRVNYYKTEVLPLSAQYSEATLTSYKSGVTEFDVQVRARLLELKHGLNSLRLRVDRAKAHAGLLYLSGDKTL